VPFRDGVAAGRLGVFPVRRLRFRARPPGRGVPSGLRAFARAEPAELASLVALEPAVDGESAVPVGAAEPASSVVGSRQSWRVWWLRS
jgi:hypothetical protein